MIGGIARYSYEIARHLHLLGDDVVVLSTRQPRDSAFDHEQKFITHRSPHFPASEISLFPSLYSVMKKYNIQKVFCPLWFPCASHTYLLGKFAGLQRPYFISVYGSETFISNATLKLRIKSKLSGLKHQTFMHANKVFPISSYTKTKMMEAGVPGEKMDIVPIGVDTQKFKPQTLPNSWEQKLPLKGRKIMLTVARLDAHKSIDFVLKALPRVLDAVPETVYLVAGTGTEEMNLKHLAVQLGLREKVFFLGGIPTDEELVLLYNACDVFIMPSREIPGRMDLIEGFGIAYLEANACGKPVIGGKSGGVPDAVADGFSGLLVEPTSLDEVANALIKLLAQTEYARQLGENGRQRVEDEFTWMHAAKKIRKIIENE